MADVYISYASADRKRADILAAALEGEGLSVVREAAPVGAARLGLRPQIGENACTLVLWSKASARAEGLALIAAQAFARGRLIPVFLHQVEPPAPYDRVEGVDISAWRGEGDDPAWQGLLHAVRATGAGKAPAAGAQTPPAAPALPPPRPPSPTPNMFQTPPRPPAAAARAEPEPAPGTGRSRLALVAVGALVLLVAAVWGGPRLAALLSQDDTRRAEVAAPADETPLDAGDAEQGQPEAQMPPAPPEEPAATAPAPGGAAPPDATLQVSAAPLATSPPPAGASGAAPASSARTAGDKQGAAGHGPAAPSSPVKAPGILAHGAQAPAAPAPATPASEKLASDKRAQTTQAVAAAAKQPAATPAPVKPALADAGASTKPADPATTMNGLEKCLATLAKLCSPVDPALAGGFGVDGRLSTGERRLLSSSIFPDRSLVTAENLNACLAATKAKSAGALGRACPSIAPKAAPPLTTVQPAIPKPITAGSPPPEPLTPPPERPISAPPL